MESSDNSLFYHGLVDSLNASVPLIFFMDSSNNNFTCVNFIDFSEGRINYTGVSENNTFTPPSGCVPVVPPSDGGVNTGGSGGSGGGGGPGVNKTNQSLIDQLINGVQGVSTGGEENPSGDNGSGASGRSAFWVYFIIISISVVIIGFAGFFILKFLRNGSYTSSYSASNSTSSSAYS